MTNDIELEDLKKHRNRRRQHLPKDEGRMGCGLSCMGVLWAFLSLVSMGLSCVGFYTPYWLEGHMEGEEPGYLGVFRRCNYPALKDRQVVIVKQCGRYSNFHDIPSVWWQVSTISIGIGCGFSILVAFTAILACCLQDVITHSSGKIGGIFQFISGLAIAVGLLLYPMGWDNSEVHQVCGNEANIYQLGHCTVSWAYWVTIGGAIGEFICCLLSCHSARSKTSHYRTYVSVPTYPQYASCSP